MLKGGICGNAGTVPCHCGEERVQGEVLELPLSFEHLFTFQAKSMVKASGK